MTVCINGRVARVLTALVILDADQIVAAPEKDEKEYMNEAMHKAVQIIENELNAYEIKLPENSKSIREIYNEPDIDKLSQREQLVLQTFHNHLKEKFYDKFHKDYDEVLPPEQVERIIEQAIMGI
jgi:ATP-dependent protease HslVU (ClpYQ) ATPase subunit